MSDRVLAIDPGTTSTKIGVFTRAGEEMARTIHHGDEELAKFRGKPMMDRMEYRAGIIEKALAAAGFTPFGRGEEPWAGVAGRGGLLPPMECGVYEVDEAMLRELRRARRGEHAANLGAGLAKRFAERAGASAFIVDPVTAEEWQSCARYSGSPLITRQFVGHALNMKAVARRFAREVRKTYAELRLVILHLGSGITVSAHRGGKIVDSNTIEEGPFGPDRTGSLPVRALVKLCFSGRFSEAELDRQVFGDGGLFAYLGTRDLTEVERRIDRGDREAEAIYDAMVYQIGKEAGAMAAVLTGKVDACIVTGGMAHSPQLIARLRNYLEWIAPLVLYPGEDELRALADGVFRVLDGVEERRRFKGSVD